MASSGSRTAMGSVGSKVAWSDAARASRMVARRSGVRPRRANFGRVSTSASSSRRGSAVTSRNCPASQASTSWPGTPNQSRPLTSRLASTVARTSLRGGLALMPLAANLGQRLVDITLEFFGVGVRIVLAQLVHDLTEPLHHLLLIAFVLLGANQHRHRLAFAFDDDRFLAVEDDAEHVGEIFAGLFGRHPFGHHRSPFSPAVYRRYSAYVNKVRYSLMYMRSLCAVRAGSRSVALPSPAAWRERVMPLRLEVADELLHGGQAIRAEGMGLKGTGGCLTHEHADPTVAAGRQGIGVLGGSRVLHAQSTNAYRRVRRLRMRRSTSGWALARSGKSAVVLSPCVPTRPQVRTSDPPLQSSGCQVRV